MLTTFQNPKWILNWGFKLEKGTLSGILYFQNYFEFCIESSKTQNTKVVHLDKIYNFAFEPQPQILLSFQVAQKGANLGFQKSGFPPLSLSKNFHPRALATTQASTHHISTLYFPKHKQSK